MVTAYDPKVSMIRNKNSSVVCKLQLSENVKIGATRDNKMVVVLSGGAAKRKYIVENGEALANLVSKIEHPVFKHMLHYALKDVNRCLAATQKLQETNDYLNYRAKSLKSSAKAVSWLRRPRQKGNWLSVVKRFFGYSQAPRPSLEQERAYENQAQFKERQAGVVYDFRQKMLMGMLHYGKILKKD